MAIIKKINWRHIITLVMLLSIFLIPYFVFAQASVEESPEGINRGFLPQQEGMTAKGLLRQLGDKAGYETAVGQNNIGAVVAAVINGFLAILGIIFLFYLIHAGYLWMTAQGNEEQVTKAKDEIRNAVIGIIIIIAAYAIVNYVIVALLENYGEGGGGVGGSTF
ncbi:hypothetical protein A3G56_00900 [Candidatus Falkowbacteria bacterium RIFCSPLOWO2_12_FULL_45_10]|uniref:Uncharacterized protein n=3 Tax=Candidatus Falkowiibacteriota TaxID=1752728 RepID=A0A1F5RWU0_9BACT|nr:MAG: hypothetical protein A3G56_00900 [Candidatus Falkowbacteria bacterium RIFCSPLOWO2_12_FULL_45_10]OGF18792.1 MAG: hypothetical protein A3D54_03145 [Candidatus Falkowbacteria bacterium RIFCSPHIGHO2_02_FULL_45_15]OGF19972.1 MAG: hypothetical protein A3I35_01430 [Candidatus Falkowbacteria bacterium RIFCSPLOWO2_02_FULL_45_15]